MSISTAKAQKLAEELLNVQVELRKKSARKKELEEELGEFYQQETSDGGQLIIGGKLLCFPKVTTKRTLVNARGEKFTDTDKLLLELEGSDYVNSKLDLGIMDRFYKDDATLRRVLKKFGIKLIVEQSEQIYFKHV